MESKLLKLLQPFYGKTLNFYFYTIAFVLVSTITINAQTTTITTTGAGSWTVPCDVTSITVEAWGAGGAGGGSTTNNDSGDGGGGGGYTNNTFAVTSGQVINYTIGAGGNGSTNNGADGGNTTFLSLTANGGTGGNRNGGGITGIGGTASGGTTNMTGSNGTAGGTNTGGWGGWGANGGAGGAGQNNGNGTDGAAPGGGGGGGERSWGNRSGGDGGNGQIVITYTSTLPTYCSPTFTTDVEPITNVTFAGINNTTTASLGGSSLESFCDTANVILGSATNVISVKGNTGGNYVDYIRVYVDWDQNGTFGNAGNEIYDIGTIANSTGLDAVTVVGNINVPAASTLGLTRMRVMKRYGAYSTGPCQTGGGYGQAEDYSVNVIAPSPCTTPTAQPTTLVLTPSGNSISGVFADAAPVPDKYLVVINNTGIAPTPVNGTTYNIGDTIGFSTVVDMDGNTIFTATGLTPLTTYFIFVYSYNSLCSGGPLYNTTSPLNGNTTTLFGSYCDAESTNDESFLYIDDIEFIGTLNDVTNLGSGYSSAFPVGYQNFTGLTNSIQAQGEGINVSVEALSRGHIKAWVDWNNDTAFDNTTELVYDTGSIGTSSTTFGFIIPAAQPVGNYRIRIRIFNSFNGAAENYSYDFDSCEEFDTNGGYNEYGEAEDYLFTVVESCSAIIETITEADNCGPGTVDLAASGSTGTVQYHWYTNETDTVPLASTLTGSWTTPSISTTTYYYVTADNGLCESLVKTKIKATIKPITTLTFTPSVPEVCGENNLIELSASATTEIAYLIDEDFEGGGLGVFTNNNIVNPGAAETAITMWQSRTSTYIPSEQVWYPAISSGFGSDNFVMATSDTGASNITENALESPSLNSSTYTDLTLNFDMYFSRYLNTAGIPENVNVEVSTNGGASWTIIQTYDDDIGYGTNFTSLSFDLSAYLNQTNLKVRIRYFADYWCDGVAIDNVQLFGTRPVTSSFTWTSSETIDAYTDAAATIPYTTGATVNTVYIKPTTAQLELNTFSFIATATLSNGCIVSENISINNKTKYWTGASSTDWNDPSNWMPTGVPTANNCVIIDDQTIISGAAYDAFARNLTVKSTGNLDLQSNNTLTVTEWVDVIASGEFSIKDDASLIQIDNVPNLGEIKMDRITNVGKYDYVYWSSPVANFAVQNVSPNTLSDHIWLWEPSISNNFGNWLLTSGSMALGKGYAIRGPNNYATAPSDYTATFVGTPNNGNTSTGISRGTYTGIDYVGPNSPTLVTSEDDNWNLIGNPYPSALDADSFLATNLEIDGTVYIWSHATDYSFSAPDPFYENYSANYSQADYIAYNSSGSTPAGYNGKIAAGQGFFVLMNDTGSQNETVFFDNSMRDRAYDNSQFYRNSNPQTQTPSEKHRIWLDLEGPTSLVSKILVGYIEGATMDKDRLYDSFFLKSNSQGLYSIIGDDEMIIQGRALPFDDSDQVPLGLDLSDSGIYTLSISSVDGLFETSAQDIYLEDTYNGIIHDLRSSPYSFTSTAGKFDDRFILRYTDNSEILSTTEFENQSGLSIYTSSNAINFVSKSSTISNITVFDVLGRRLIDYKNIDVFEYNLTDLKPTNGMLLVNVVLSNGKTITKKVVH